MTEPALFSLENQRGSRPLDVVSWGAGVESSAYLTEILTNPNRHDVDPQNLVLLRSAACGSELVLVGFVGCHRPDDGGFVLPNHNHPGLGVGR
ncbi:hypothetical protein [Amycolatopsis sp. lyj-23]|uniref:hypothetical protein n=1 Tax=Amycolatopsis sp. lyj-23 TaxID=2789283 RepID=UPI003978A835